MIKLVQSNRIILTASNGSEYIPFLCVQGLTITKTRGVLATATPDSGTDETFAYDGLAVTTLTMNGLTALQHETQARFTIFDLMGDSPQTDIRILFTDEGGFERSIDCTVLFPTAGIDKNVGSLSKWNTTMQVTGPMVFGPLLLEIGGIFSHEFSDEFA